MEQLYTPKQDYKVLARCLTYNQSKYIEDALNGFAIQKTNFPFACLIMDDCSTDGEQEVIKAWMDRECDMAKAEYVDIELSNVILVPHKTNSNCTFAFYLLKQNLYGTGEKKMKHVTPWRDHCEYEAICEGDDYWIDPTKLQQQADYLDNNPDCSMCFHNAFIHETTGDKCSARVFQPSAVDFDLTFEVALNDWLVPTQSMMYRRSMYKGKPDWQAQIYSGDIALILNLCLAGRVHCIGKCMSVYRVVNDGKSASQQTRGSFYFEQTKKLYESFYNAPMLTESQRLSLDESIGYVDHLLDYQKAKKSRKYLRLLSLPKLLIILNTIKQKIRHKYGIYKHMAAKDYFGKSINL